eukprot:scaffold109861_cov70-Attheya_sp.AAC.1
MEIQEAPTTLRHNLVLEHNLSLYQTVGTQTETDTSDGSLLMNTAHSARDRDYHQETNISMSLLDQKAQHTFQPSDIYYIITDTTK